MWQNKYTNLKSAILPVHSLSILRPSVKHMQWSILNKFTYYQQGVPIILILPAINIHLPIWTIRDWESERECEKLINSENQL